MDAAQEGSALADACLHVANELPFFTEQHSDEVGFCNVSTGDWVDAGNAEESVVTTGEGSTMMCPLVAGELPWTLPQSDAGGAPRDEELVAGVGDSPLVWSTGVAESAWDADKLD